MTFPPQMSAIHKVEERLRHTQGAKDRATVVGARQVKHNAKLGHSGKYFRAETYDF